MSWDSPNPSYPNCKLRERFFCQRQPVTVRAETHAPNRKALATLDNPFMGPQKIHTTICTGDTVAKAEPDFAYHCSCASALSKMSP